jgi:MFS family permease
VRALTGSREAARGTGAVIAAIVFAITVAAFARVPVLPDLGFELRLSAGEIGLLTTAFGLGRLAMDLPAGRLAAAVDPIAALVVAGGGLALGAAVLASSGSFVVALAASAFIGCASALTNTTGMYAFATATEADRRGASMAVFTTALMSGQMLGPALGGAIGSLADWRAAIAASAAIGVAVAVAGLAARRRLPRAAGIERARAAARVDQAPAPPPAARRELLALAAAPFATFFGMAGLTQTLIPLIGAEELAFSASTIGFAVAAGAAARFASAWLAGIASDRWSRKVVLVPMLATMALGAGLLALPIGTGAWFAAIIALAIGSSGISVAAAALADRVEAERLGHELGVFRLVGDLGLLIGPAASAFLYQAEGPRTAALAAAALFCVAALVAALWIRGAPGTGGGEELGEPLLE